MGKNFCYEGRPPYICAALNGEADRVQCEHRLEGKYGCNYAGDMYEGVQVLCMHPKARLFALKRTESGLRM